MDASIIKSLSEHSYPINLNPRANGKKLYKRTKVSVKNISWNNNEADQVSVPAVRTKLIESRKTSLSLFRACFHLWKFNRRRSFISGHFNCIGLLSHSWVHFKVLFNVNTVETNFKEKFIFNWNYLSLMKILINHRQPFDGTWDGFKSDRCSHVIASNYRISSWITQIYQHRPFPKRVRYCFQTFFKDFERSKSFYWFYQNNMLMKFDPNKIDSWYIFGSQRRMNAIFFKIEIKYQNEKPWVLEM